MESSNGISPSDGPEIVQGSENVSDGSHETRTGKAPRRVLHFSDGVLEEYSTDDEEEEVDKPDPSKAIDTKKLSWPRYFLYATMAFGNGTLKVCDYLGEGLANILGITTPKYQYEINEYERMVKEQEEAKKKEDIEMRGWRENSSNDNPPVVSTSPGPAVATISETQERY
ncbi:hypothetical protein R5R35_011671 [Gryllus longicercus]|uniref:Protein FAM177A1 n=1 Tax=Gryllus longicercus TaxID=2509291 RepID=A0AAN9Z331_9ORTH